MQLSTKERQATLVISVDEPRIDAVSAIQFKEAMRTATNATKGRIVLDMSAVTFIDSSGLGAVVAAMKQLKPGQTLDLAGLTPDVERVFRLTRMDTVFGIHASVDDAISLEASD